MTVVNKYKTGDKLKATDGWGGLEVGKVYEVESRAFSTEGNAWIMLKGVKHRSTCDGSFKEDQFEPAPSGRVEKVKVGDWVRVLHTDYEDCIPVGSVVQVDEVDTDGDADLKAPNGESSWFFYASEFEPWVPKVGDNVKVVDNMTNGGDPIRKYEVGKTYPVTKIDHTSDYGKVFLLADHYQYLKLGQIAPAPVETTSTGWTIKDAKPGDTVTTTNWKGQYFTDGKPYQVDKDGMISDNNGRKIAAVDMNYVTWRLVLPAFRIEAGKFYKTRDGRKVGPAESADRDGDHWLSPTGFYKSNGLYIGFESVDGYQSHLVAEWVEPAKPTVAAQVDTLAEEYGPVVPAAAPKHKFKVGDRVRFTDQCPDYWYFGPHSKYKTGVISEFCGERGTYQYRVKMDDSNTGGVDDKHIDLIATNPTAIVCLIEDGQPKPATRPYVHPTVGSAQTEASRLANKHKGQKFGVYVLTGDPVAVAKPEYKQAWQREAANGNKISAIRELRSVTDIGLKAAKDAVEEWLGRPEWMRAA